MSTGTLEKRTVAGVVRGGVVVPVEDLTLPDGTSVEIALPLDLSEQEINEDFTLWDRASTDAWKLIEEWEQAEGVSPEDIA